jgi:hypothetical protein
VGINLSIYHYFKVIFYRFFGFYPTYLSEKNISRGNKVMKIRGGILLIILIVSVSIISCTPKFMKPDRDQSIGIEINQYSSEELLTAYKKNIEAEAVAELPSPLEKETEGLRYILEPYLNIGSEFYIGEENKKFLEANLLSNESPYLPVTAKDWEKVVRIIFMFNNSENDETAIKLYIRDFAKDDEIERQYAVAGLMKLLTLKYRLSLGEDTLSLQKSEVISDINEIEDKHQVLVREAYCLGFTDFSVDKNKIFRPYDSLNSAEAISMLYRVLSNLGLPGSVQAAEPDGAQLPANDDENLPEIISNAFSVEVILLEYNEYKADLQNSSKSSLKKRLEMLLKAEDIIGIDFSEYYEVDQPLMLEQWAKILDQVFALDPGDIDPYLSFENGGTVSYDIVAISVMSSYKKLVGAEPGDVDEKELEEARAAIPQFDTSKDTGKFAKMFSSGLLEGLYNIPGFTPQRPVSQFEALLLVKRITEQYKMK